MHRTPSGDRRQALQKEARELARDARALQKAAARALVARQEALRLQDLQLLDGILARVRQDAQCAPGEQ
ncbi:MAG: hypothetical protein PHN61_10895 [Methanothrix sp.]|nr:hypothetical protein [Methanothrix sp.]